MAERKIVDGQEENFLIDKCENCGFTSYSVIARCPQCGNQILVVSRGGLAKKESDNV